MVSRSGSIQRKGERVLACDAVTGVMVVPSTKELHHAIIKVTSDSNDDPDISFRFPDIKEAMNVSSLFIYIYICLLLFKVLILNPCPPKMGK